MGPIVLEEWLECAYPGPIVGLCPLWNTLPTGEITTEPNQIMIEL